MFSLWVLGIYHLKPVCWLKSHMLLSFLWTGSWYDLDYLALSLHGIGTPASHKFFRYEYSQMCRCAKHYAKKPTQGRGLCSEVYWLSSLPILFSEIHAWFLIPLCGLLVADIWWDFFHGDTWVMAKIKHPTCCFPWQIPPGIYTCWGPSGWAVYPTEHLIDDSPNNIPIAADVPIKNYLLWVIVKHMITVIRKNRNVISNSSWCAAACRLMLRQ